MSKPLPQGAIFDIQSNQTSKKEMDDVKKVKKIAGKKLII